MKIYKNGQKQKLIEYLHEVSESFQQGSFLWPPYVQQGSNNPLQQPQNFIFPAVNPQTNAQSQPFAAPLQLLGSNYLTSTSTVCQRSQVSGNRFLSISSDTKRIEQSQRYSSLKIENWGNEHINLNKDNLMPQLTPTDRVNKSKEENTSTFLQMSSNIGESLPLVAREQSHIILHSPTPEFINNQTIATNYLESPDTTPIQPLSEPIGGIFKNTAIGISTFSKTPEMQDVNIQTDTPVCSEDENSILEVCTQESVLRPLQCSDKNKTSSSHYHYNNPGVCKAAAKGDSFEQPLNDDFTKQKTIFISSEASLLGNKTMSKRTANKKMENVSCEGSIVQPSGALNEISTFKVTNEMSGLELLSNISTSSFINSDLLKTVCVKREPSEIIENDQNPQLTNYESYNNNPNTKHLQNNNESDTHNTINVSPQNSEPSLGGLNLLCALAEQRIHEEVESNSYKNIVSKQKLEVKRKKHKHSKSKSRRKPRCNKRKTKFNKELMSDCEEGYDSLESSTKKCNTSFNKLNKWANAEDFFKAMESDMRMRLADITRQYKKKKRKLEEIYKIKKRKKISSDYKFANISCKNPNFICFLDKFQSSSSDFPLYTETSEYKLHEKGKSENTETCEEYEEKTIDVINNKNSETNTPFNKSEPLVSLCVNKVKKEKKKRRGISDGDNKSIKGIFKLASQRTTDIVKQKNKHAIQIDNELVLSNEHLYRNETRVLTDMGGLFYAGILKPLQPPDVYSITLDGERGNKSHIMSREEIFKDTILEVTPKSIDKVPTGTRLCAYWSQQYRCLYPGRAIESDISDTDTDFVSVEFDDGDSGRIRLQNIRFLLSDYPIVEYNENPLNSGRNKKSGTNKSSRAETMPKESSLEVNQDIYCQEPKKVLYANRFDKKNNQFEKNKSPSRNECPQKHRKHKKKRKHKKHFRKSFSQPSTTVGNLNDGDDYNNSLIEEGKEMRMESNGIENNQFDNIPSESEPSKNVKEKEKLSGKMLDEYTNSVEDEDSTSNSLFDTIDESTSRKIDTSSCKGSKIAAFLPQRQLWGWLGQAYRKANLKGKAKKQFYKSITRGKEIITVGECAVFLSTGRPDRPYIGRIEALWETTSSNKVVRVRWFYHPEETTGCPKLKYPGALFDSPHEDENDVQTISHRCEVIKFSTYIEKIGSDTIQHQSIYDNNDVYYLSGYYNPRLQVLQLDEDIPTLDDTSE